MKNNWYIYERGGALFSTLDAHFRALVNPPRNKNYHLLPYFWCAFRGKHLYWAYGTPEFYDLGKTWTRQWIKQGVNSPFFVAERKFYEEARKYAFDIFNQPLPSSVPELIKIFRKLSYFTSQHTLILGFVLDAFDEVFPEIYIKDLTKMDYGRVVKDFSAMADLSRPAYRSVVGEYQLAILKLAMGRKRVSEAQLQKFYREYFWLSLGWAGTGEKTKSAIIRDLDRLSKKSPIELKREIKGLQNYASSIGAQRQKISKQYKIPPAKIKPYFDIIDYCTLLHDRRKELQMRYMFLLAKIRAHIAKKRHLPISKMHWMTDKEVEKLLVTGEIPKAAIKQRKLGHSMMIEPGKSKETVGKEAVAIMDRLTTIKLGDTQTVTGTPASSGHAIGKAVVTSNPVEAIKHLKRGNILVTSMTTPDFVPAMRKAAAIITDEGGITSHAAIISRELGIPCVIGTKIGTKIFKTGDIIEVDADKGIVTKLKK